MSGFVTVKNYRYNFIFFKLVLYSRDGTIVKKLLFKGLIWKCWHYQVFVELVSDFRVLKSVCVLIISILDKKFV
jgi:hypothetical protein